MYIEENLPTTVKLNPHYKTMLVKSRSSSYQFSTDESGDDINIKDAIEGFRLAQYELFFSIQVDFLVLFFVVFCNNFSVGFVQEKYWLPFCESLQYEEMLKRKEVLETLMATSQPPIVLFFTLDQVRTTISLFIDKDKAAASQRGVYESSSTRFDAVLATADDKEEEQKSERGARRDNGKGLVAFDFKD